MTEIVRSSPFGCTSVVHNRRFQNNLNDLVTSCINPNDDSRHIDYADLWVHHPHWQTIPTHSQCEDEHKANNDEVDKNIDNSGLIHRGGKIENATPRHVDKDKWARARQIVFSVDSSSRTLSESSVEIPNLQGGVSSLVQKWRGFEADAKCSRSYSVLDNAGPVPTASTDDDAMFGDWESDRTACSGPPSARSRDSDAAADRERLRVVDIIRKLTEERLNDAGYDFLPRYGTSSSDHPQQSESQKCFPSATFSSPRIRGRQAFNDLLVQMERERHNELERLVAHEAVSKFSQRGRIQAALRARFLRRGVEAKEGRHSNDPSYEAHKPTRYGFLHFRERGNPSFPNSLARSGSQLREENQNQHHQASQVTPNVGEDYIQDEESSTNSKQSDVHHSFPEVDHNQLNTSSQSSHHAYEVESSLWQVIRSDHSTDRLAVAAPVAQSLQSAEISMHAEHEDCTNQDLEFRGDKLHLTRAPPCYVRNVSNKKVGLKEFESNHLQHVDNTIDWINEVSRPRSDWEGLRQVRYQEMLDPFMENDEIRVLIERRSVSNFLSSSLRDQIDRVMRSHAQRQHTPMSNHIQDKERPFVEGDKNENDEPLVSNIIKRDMEDEHDEEKTDYGDYYDEYDKAQSPIGILYNEFDDDMDQMISFQPPSWTQNQVNDVSDYSDQIGSPSTQQSLSSNLYSQDNQPSPTFTTQPTIEIDLMYDLKGQMEQLHREISELRKSIKCCMNMQLKLERSFKQDVAAASRQSDKKIEHHKSVKKASGRRCYICRKMQVDSLLYRCGHMCTCFDCSQELQWGSGTCPICRAPIVDVVRTY